MKKIFLLVFLVVSWNSFSVDLMNIDTTFTVGLITNGSVAMYAQEEYKSLQLGNQGFTDFEITAWFLDTLFFGGGTRCYFTSAGKLNFSPHRLDYTVWTGFHFKFLTIRWTHECIHPQYTYLACLANSDFDSFPWPEWEGSIEKIEVSINISTRR